MNDKTFSCDLQKSILSLRMYECQRSKEVKVDRKAGRKRKDVLYAFFVSEVNSALYNVSIR